MRQAEREFTICVVALGVTVGITGGLVFLGYGLKSESVLGVAQLFTGLSLIFGLGLVYWGWRLWRGL